MMKELSIFSRAETFGERVALWAGEVSVTYADLLRRSRDVAVALLRDDGDLKERRVCLLTLPGEDYVVAQWGIWRAGGIVVPLCLAATDSEWDYTVEDSGGSDLICSPAMADRGSALAVRHGMRLLLLEELEQIPAVELPEVCSSQKAMILYTSGTTSRPKGVVSTHEMVQAQIESLVEAWGWSQDDRIPLFLPLHHIHGIINVLSCGLWSGAIVESFNRFDLNAVMTRVREDAYTVFMAVPTIYVKMIEYLESITELERQAISAGFKKQRLMISGSAALPSSIHIRWQELTGQVLLERYGMTEIGMALSNPLVGERRPGAVGQPLPGVAIRLVSENGEIISEEGESGEIQVRGASVFQEYWNREEATRDSFSEGWFCTGDVAVKERGYYRILGRRSIDIIKSGGYKLSALEIEAVLLEHPRIQECAVIGVADATWGEAVSAAIVLSERAGLSFQELREWCRSRLSSYKLPQRLVTLESLPRNAMGKVTKPALRGLF